MNRIDKIVLNIPHSSSVFPDGVSSGWEEGIQKEIERWTDSYTDRLFHTNMENVVSVVFPYSRFYCDAERLDGDPLEKEGRGIIYTNFNGISRTGLTDEERSDIMRLYHEHKKMVSEQIISDNCLLIDCHSFPGDLSDIDFCIGYNDDWSKPDDAVIDTVSKYFTELGYKVGINEPYSNSYSPKTEYEYKSLMIEVNKNVYLNSRNEIDGFFYKKNAMIQGLYRRLFDIYT